MTDEARTALGHKAYVRMTTFPFRIGRENRSLNPLAGVVTRMERRLGTTPQLNDLYLIERPELAQVSRTHCAIEWVDGAFMLVDRGSPCGSTVIESRANERPAAIATMQVGGGGAFRSAVRDGDVIVIGHIDSPYVFRFQVEPEPLPRGLENAVLVR